MANKASRLSGYNLGMTGTSGNSAEIVSLDTGDTVFASFSTIGGGGNTNDPFVKMYPQVQVNGLAPQSLPVAPLTGIACVAYGWVNGAPIWVALANSSTTTAGSLFTSTDGKTWISRSVGGTAGAAWKSIAFGNGVFVAVNGAATTTTSLAYSADGITWVYPTITAPGGAWKGVAFGGTQGNGHFVAWASGATATSTWVWSSTNGQAWTGQASPASAGNWSGAAWGNPTGTATGMWVLTALGTTTTTTVYTSVPGAVSSNTVALGTFAAVTLPFPPVTVGPVGVAYHPNTAIFNSTAVNTTLNLYPFGGSNLPDKFLVVQLASSSISGTTLTVPSTTSLSAGMLVVGDNVLPDTYIVSGSTTTYTVTKSQTSLSGTYSFYSIPANYTPNTGRFVIICGTASIANTGASAVASSTIAGTVMTLGTTSALVFPGQVVTGTGVTAGTYVISGSGTTYTVSPSQTVASTALTTTGPQGVLYTFDGTTAGMAYPVLTQAPGSAWLKIWYGQGYLWALNAGSTTTSVDAQNLSLMYSKDGLNWQYSQIPAQLVTSTASSSIAGTALTLGSSSSAVFPGQLVVGTGVTGGTVIVSGSGTSYVVSPSQTVASTTISTYGISALTCGATGDFLSGILVLGTSTTGGTTLKTAAIESGIVGGTMLLEISTGGAAEGFPDLFIPANANGFSPDMTRFL